jgi:NAD(P)-dependent dehydrogenase (short-subunit alcohol dehydrogenase family)
MQIDLKDKNILVTGGAGDGLGQGICEAVDAAGGKVIVNDLVLEMAEEAAKKYPGAFAVEGDISKSDDVTKMFSKIKEACGTIHGLINNAGIGLGKYALDADESEVNRLL